MAINRRILVADDDAGVRDLVRTYLSAEGYEVHQARDGLEAFLKLHEVRPVAMILDINMPKLDGFAVLERVRAAKIEPIPILVLTARHAADDVKRAIGGGAKDYLTKPFSGPQLLARIARLMRAASLTVPA